VVLGVVVFLGLVWVVWEQEDGEAARGKLGAADDARVRAASRPGPERRLAVTRVARGLAVAPLVVLAVAYVPMAYEPDGQGVLTAMRVLVLTAVAVVFGDWLMARSAKGPWHSPHHWWFTAAIVGVASGSLVAVNAMGRTLPLAVAFLMFAGLLLSEAQRFAETVPVPKGLLFLGFTRTPVALLIALCVAVGGLSYPTDAVESWSTNLRQVVRMASTVMAFEPAST
jgi:MFS family permease